MVGGGGGYRLFGFLLGSTVSGGAAYLYLLDEYKVSNELLTEDVEVCFPFLFPGLDGGLIMGLYIGLEDFDSEGGGLC